MVDTLETERKLGNLKDAMVFLCTDNSTVERCVYKGSSSSKKLSDLVVWIKLLKKKIIISFISHIYQVQGYRNKEQIRFQED